MRLYNILVSPFKLNYKWTFAPYSNFSPVYIKVLMKLFNSEKNFLTSAAFSKENQM